MYDKVVLALEKDHIETIIGLLTDRLMTAETCKESAYREVNELREQRDHLVAENAQMCREYVAMQNNLNALMDKLPDEAEDEDGDLDE